MIRAILWDVDGTLLDFLAAEKVAVRRCFECFHLGECTDEMIRAYSAINVKYWKILERGEMTKPEILVGRFREFFSQYGIDPQAADAFNKEYQVRLGDTICFQPGAKETLLALRGTLPQVAVTNGTKVAQTRKLKNSGMDAIFDAVFISEDVGIEKPNKAYFDAVLAFLGPLAKEEIMIVGDSLTSDILGGNNAGIRTCWYNPSGLPRPENLRIDDEIQRIDQVLDLIRRENVVG